MLIVISEALQMFTAFDSRTLRGIYSKEVSGAEILIHSNVTQNKKTGNWGAWLAQ